MHSIALIFYIDFPEIPHCVSVGKLNKCHIRRLLIAMGVSRQEIALSGAQTADMLSVMLTCLVNEHGTHENFVSRHALCVVVIQMLH